MDKALCATKAIDIFVLRENESIAFFICASFKPLFIANHQSPTIPT